MLLYLLFPLLLSVLGVSCGENNLQSDVQTKMGLLKSLIYNNTKATVTLDSSALKQLIKLLSESSNHSRRISFSVYVKSNVLTLGSGQTVKYDTILTNDGNGYDDRTGVFTCPVAGTYMFVVDSLSKPGIWLFLKVNNNAVGKLHVSVAHKDKPFVQISRTVIVRLKSGDHVRVENYSNNGIIHDGHYSGFTGVRLY
eukprot:XP_011411936.1 PREDICTED: complement C1q-like protein 3 [Crassostrea gigas]